MDTRVRHRRCTIDGTDIFYRDAGPADAPVVLLPHGYPCSSYEFRNLMPALADRWRLLAPDYPGVGYSATPDDFDYSFDGYADFLDGFVRAMGVERFALYLHDFGSPIGVRLAIKAPERVAALIIPERRHSLRGRAWPEICRDREDLDAAAIRDAGEVGAGGHRGDLQGGIPERGATRLGRAHPARSVEAALAL